MATAKRKMKPYRLFNGRGLYVYTVLATSKKKAIEEAKRMGYDAKQAFE